MANYTMTLCDLLNKRFTNRDNPDAPYIDIDRLFPSFTLPIEGHADDLKGKIVAHYFNREIGQESVEAFLLYFRTTFLEALPKYKVMLEAMNRDFFQNMNIGNKTRTTGTEGTVSSGSSSNTNQSTSSTSGDTKQEDTPYSQLSASADYASGKGHSSSSGSSSGSGSGTTSNNSTLTHNTTVEVQTAREIENARAIAEMFVDADLYIINALDTCFMQVF